MTAVAFSERVSARVSTVAARAVVLSILAFPVFLLGLIVGGIAHGVLWCCAACAEGFDTGHRRDVSP